MNPVIKPHHLERIAYVYLRQSSPGQVKRNREGQQRQRAMVDHVSSLGWPRSQIVLLDGDNGRSGSSQHGRVDLKNILEAIVTGRVGLVAARELSRLVRDNQDWGHVVRLCRFEDVLLADERRLYDPRDPQDRMVLGVQGAFNEFELSMIVDRMHESLRAKARRGEQYDGIAPGYICRQGTLLEKHPDPRVQRSVERVLHGFAQFPSVRQFYLQLRRENFQLFVVTCQKDWREVKSITPSYSQILEMIRNPVYAGIYARGRRKTTTVLDEQCQKRTTRRRVPQESWEVCIDNHHAPYISRETWESYVEKIEANATAYGDQAIGSPGKGSSLMAGLLRCQRCGRRLRASYSSRGVYYTCRGGRKQRDDGVKGCFSFAGQELEARLADEILEVVSPAGIAAAERATQRMNERHLGERQLLVDRLCAAQEAERRAAREYKETDITYTAVRQALGAEWERALGCVHEEQSRLQAFDEHQVALPTPSQRILLDNLQQDVHRLWNHPHVSTSRKQQLARLLIKEIIVDIDEHRSEVVLLIRWSGGHHTELRQPIRKRLRSNLSQKNLREVVSTLRKVLDDKGIAAVLNRGHVHNASGKTWNAKRVKEYRQREGIAAFSAEEKAESGWLTQAETATQLEISPMSVHRLVRAGIIPAEQPCEGGAMVIHGAHLTERTVQQAIVALKTGQTNPLPEDPRQRKLF